MLRRVAKITNLSIALSTRRGFSELKKFENNFLSTTNIVYIESLYQKWVQDKNSVSPSFAAFFQ